MTVIGRKRRSWMMLVMSLVLCVHEVGADGLRQESGDDGMRMMISCVSETLDLGAQCCRGCTDDPFQHRQLTA